MKISEENMKEARKILNKACGFPHLSGHLLVSDDRVTQEIASALQSKSDEIAALKAHIAELEEQSAVKRDCECAPSIGTTALEWRTADSAPLDGTVLILLVNDIACEGYYDWKTNNFVIGCPINLPEIILAPAPTHWMPRPETPPKEK